FRLCVRQASAIRARCAIPSDLEVIAILRTLIRAIAAAALGILAGCAQTYDGPAQSEIIAGATRPFGQGDLGDRTYHAVDSMLNENASLTRSGASVVVGSVADIQDVNR